MANGFVVFNFSCRSKDAKGLDKIKNGFWKAVLCTYLDTGKVTTEKEINSENVYFQQLWNNSLIQYKNNLLFYPNGKDKALNTLKTSQTTTKNDYLPLKK